MKSTLEITGGGEAPRSVPLQEGTTTIGRADTNIIVLNNANISRIHVEIRIDSSGAQVADMNSVNGTSINDVKLAPQAWQPLKAGDRITVGPFQLSYDQTAENDATVVIDRAALMPQPPPSASTPLPWATPLPTPVPPPIPAYVPPVAPVPEPVASIPVEEPITPPEQPAPAAPWPDPTPACIDVPAAAQVAPVYATPYPAARPAGRPMGKEKVALILLAIAVALTLPASFAAWNQRVLLSQDKFVSLGNDVLSKPAVQRELAVQLSKEIDRTNTNLLKDLGMPAELEQLSNDILNSIFGSGSPSTPSGSKGKQTQDSFLDEIMVDTIRTLPNTPVADSALIATHGALKTAVRDSSVSTQNDVIALEIGDGMSQLFGFAGIIGIRGDELGGDFGRIEITKNADTVRALKLIRFFDGKAILFVMLVVVALGAGMYFADDRIRYTKYAGLALIGSSVVWILAAMGPVKGWILGDGGDTASAKAAIKATYDVIAGSYIQQELIVIGVGVVVLAFGLVQGSRAAKSAAMTAPPAPDV